MTRPTTTTTTFNIFVIVFAIAAHSCAQLSDPTPIPQSLPCAIDTPQSPLVQFQGYKVTFQNCQNIGAVELVRQDDPTDLTTHRTFACEPNISTDSTLTGHCFFKPQCSGIFALSTTDNRGDETFSGLFTILPSSLSTPPPPSPPSSPAPSPPPPPEQPQSPSPAQADPARGTVGVAADPNVVIASVPRSGVSKPVNSAATSLHRSSIYKMASLCLWS